MKEINSVERLSLILGPLFILCLLSCSGKEKNIDCSQFKTGRFVFHNAFTGTDILVKRNDSTQTSIDEKTGMGNKCKIQWTGECQYKLWFLSFIINGRDSVFGNYESSTGTTAILETTKNYYISETQLDGEQGIHRDTLWVSSQ